MFRFQCLQGRTKKLLIVLAAAVTAAVITVLCIYWEVPRRIRLMVPGGYSVEDDVERYLEERYGEKFVVTNKVYEYYSGYYKLEAYSKEKPQYDENMITVQGWKKGGVYRYYDNYPLVKLIPECEKYISDIVCRYFPDNKVYVYFSHLWNDNNLDIPISLNDILNGKDGGWYGSMSWEICVPINNMTDEEILTKSNAAVAAIAKGNIWGMGWINIMYYDNYDRLPEHRERDMLGKNGIDFVDLDYYIVDEDEFEKQTEVK